MSGVLARTPVNITHWIPSISIRPLVDMIHRNIRRSGKKWDSGTFCRPLLVRIEGRPSNERSEHKPSYQEHRRQGEWLGVPFRANPRVRRVGYGWWECRNVDN